MRVPLVLCALLGAWMLPPITAVLCTPGEYLYNNTECIGCENGKYAPQALTDSCLTCSAGSHTNNDTHATECSRCDTGYTSKSGSSSCSLAESGYYLYPSSSSSDGVISHSCAKHSICMGGLTTPLPHDGYWVDHSDSLYLDALYKCHRATCKGGSSLNSSECFHFHHFNHTKQCKNIQCKKGSSGPLCGSCNLEYIYESTSKECVKCNSDAENRTYLFLIAFFVVILFYWAFTTDLKYFLKSDKKKSSFLIDFVECFEFANFKVLWTTFQITQSLTYTLDIKFPLLFRYLLKFLSFLSFNVLSFECFLQHYWNNEKEETIYYYSVYAWSALPLILAILLTAITWIRIKLQTTSDSTVISKEASTLIQQKKSEIYDNYLWLLLLLMFLVTPPVVMKQLSAFQCIELAETSGDRFLRIETNISCDNDSYLFFRWIVLGCFGLYQLLIISCYIWLRRQREKLNPLLSSHKGSGVTSARDEEITVHVRNKDISLNSLRFLFKDYKCNKWWFDIIDMYRRIVFIGCLPLISNSSSTVRASFGCILAILSLCFYREQQPFNSDFTNKLSYYSQAVIFVTFYFALYISNGYTLNFVHLSGWKLGLFLVILHASLLMVVIYYSVRTTQLFRLKEATKEFAATHYEKAIDFKVEKFTKIFEDIWRYEIPSTHTLAFHYTSLRSGKQAVKSGIPTNLTYEGVAITLRPPHFTTRGDFEVFSDPEKKRFPPRNKYTKQLSTDDSDIKTFNNGKREFPHEHVLVLSLPKQFLTSLPGYEEDEALRLVPAEVLNAMRPPIFDAVYDPQPWRDKKTLLSPTCILRSYWIFDFTATNVEGNSDSGIGRTFIRAVSSFRLSSSPSFVGDKEDVNQNQDEDADKNTKLALKDKAFKHKIDSVTKIELVSEYIQDMKYIRSQAARSNLVPFYHYTSRKVAQLIIDGGLRMNGGRSGDEGGVFVSTLGPASYGIGTKEYEVNIIKDCFGLIQNVDEHVGKGKFDVIIIYGCAPIVFEQSPVGRDNARVVKQSTFEAFSLPHPDCGSYYLRPDRILEVFEVQSSSISKSRTSSTHPPYLDRDSNEGCEAERMKDHVVIDKLQEYHAKRRENESQVNKGLLRWWKTSFGGSYNLVESPPPAALTDLEGEGLGRDARESIEFESSSIKSPSKSMSFSQSSSSEPPSSALLTKEKKKSHSFSLFGASSSNKKKVNTSSSNVFKANDDSGSEVELSSNKVSDRAGSTGRTIGGVSRSISMGRSKSSPRDVVIPSNASTDLEQDLFGQFEDMEGSTPPSKLTLVPCPTCGRTFAPATAERHIPRCKGGSTSVGRNSSLGRNGSLGRNNSLNRGSSTVQSPTNSNDQKKKRATVASPTTSPSSPSKSTSNLSRRNTASTSGRVASPKAQKGSPNKNSTLLGTAL